MAPARAESEIAATFDAFAARTPAATFTSFLGAGAYRHYTPPIVGALAMRGEFLTAYTRIKPKCPQGYLQAIYEWQTYIALLTGLDVANASVMTAPRHSPKARSWRSTQPTVRRCSSRRPFTQITAPCYAPTPKV